LIPEASRRVLCAGRCVSSDTYANSALRVEAPCMAMGQVAGVAGAIMAKRGQEVSRVSHGELCEGLRGIGAIVPDDGVALS
ncbi:MAG: FAD-dependent oxidoreductase, partial [Clostridia bacterium]|nr:FAD-dependent oxidoreductase [Clostridia bacterium]